MFDLGKKLSLESFQLLSVAFFRFEHSTLSKIEFVSRNSNCYFKCREQKHMKNSLIILHLTFWNFLLSYQSIYLPQVKWYLIYSIASIIYKLPRELPNHLRFWEFGRLDFDFVFLALKKFGYGDKVIHMIKVCYNNIQSKI